MAQQYEKGAKVLITDNHPGSTGVVEDDPGFGAEVTVRLDSSSKLAKIHRDKLSPRA